jgi:predicted lipid-binding transport protein (Tim44 family)
MQRRWGVKRSLRVAAGIAVVLVRLSSAHADEQEDRAQEEATVKRLATQWQEAWNKHDMDALASLVAEDVDFVTVSGAWLRDRKAFKEHHARMHVVSIQRGLEIRPSFRSAAPGLPAG